MKTEFPKSIAASLVMAGVLSLAACSSVPTTTPTLDQARADFVAANNNPQVSASAPMEFRQASEALDRANQAAAQRESLETIDRLAYIAKQRIATAQEVAKGKSAEADAAAAARERDRVQLEARTAEADRAKREAAAAQLQIASAQAQAADAQMQAQAAQQQAAQLAERSARLEAILVELHAQKTERGMVVTIGDVLFATDRAELNANGMATVRKLAEVMMQNPDRSVLVEGFTDSTGSAAHNKDLSERRAQSVAQALTGLGVPRQRVDTRGYGEAYPVAGNDSAADRQRNRRVEIVLSNEGATVAPRAAQR